MSCLEREALGDVAGVLYLNNKLLNSEACFMKNAAKCVFTVLVLFSVSMPLLAADILKYMGNLQYFTHKAWLAVNAKNAGLANFYAHEMESTIEQIEAIETFDGHTVGKLASTMLVPEFVKLETAIKAAQWGDVEKAFARTVDACNRCHQATDHGFLKIELNSHNPYMQSFDVK